MWLRLEIKRKELNSKLIVILTYIIYAYYLLSERKSVEMIEWA